MEKVQGLASRRVPVPAVTTAEDLCIRVGVSLALGSADRGLCAMQQLQEFCGKWDGGSVGFL